MKVSKGEIFERLFVNEEVHLQIDQEAHSHVKIYVINAPFSITVNQLEEGCQTEIYALEHLRGEESVTAETHVTHAVGGGTSNQLIKFVLDDNARGRFIGDLKIAPDAQQTEAHQTNRNWRYTPTMYRLRTAPLPVNSTNRPSSTCSNAVLTNKKRVNCSSARL